MEPFKFEFYVYSNRNGYDVKLMYTVKEEDEGNFLNLQQNIYVITANPSNDDIFALGTSDGNIILVDV